MTDTKKGKLEAIDNDIAEMRRIEQASKDMAALEKDSKWINVFENGLFGAEVDKVVDSLTGAYVLTDEDLKAAEEKLKVVRMLKMYIAGTKSIGEGMAKSIKEELEFREQVRLEED